MSSLLTETITVPASRVTLQDRLDTRLREREWRKQRNDKYPTSVSDGWLEGEIQALEAALARTPAAGVRGTPAAYEGPAKFTPEEVEMGNIGIRWVTATQVGGRPTLHDVLDYIERRGDAIDCTCERCTAWKARNAGVALPDGGQR